MSANVVSLPSQSTPIDLKVDELFVNEFSGTTLHLPHIQFNQRMGFALSPRLCGGSPHSGRFQGFTYFLRLIVFFPVNQPKTSVFKKPFPPKQSVVRIASFAMHCCVPWPKGFECKCHSLCFLLCFCLVFENPYLTVNIEMINGVRTFFPAKLTD